MVIEGAGAALISGNMFDTTPDGAILCCLRNDLAKTGAGNSRA